MKRPFEVKHPYLKIHIDDLVQTTFDDLQSQFLILPLGSNFVEYPRFQDAYEVLKRRTSTFKNWSAGAVWDALREDSLAFLVLRTILGMSTPEWAELANSDLRVDIEQNAARRLDVVCRKGKDFFERLAKGRGEETRRRVDALVEIAVQYIGRGAGSAVEGAVHRLNKVDTSLGLESLRHVASRHVPYAVLLYERYLGRPFASHRDSISGIIGDGMESVIEDCLSRAGLTFRKTKGAERVEGFEQAPDFIVPDEWNPAVVIEAKITGDDGTARDKVARIERLVAIAAQRMKDRGRAFQVVACIDGRGFRVRKKLMEQLIMATKGKVFTFKTISSLIENTRLSVLQVAC
ncbi:MAG: hypothetical protein HYX75_08865 [Acidobacteria bacterium]|nr:hypothetical protein [Acidobacteriota bacterium]